MTFRTINWAYEQPVKPAARKFLLVTLANYANEHGECFPGQKRLASDTGQSVRSVSDHLADLEEDGLIKRCERQRPNGARSSDGFVLNIPKDKLQISQPANLAGSENPQGQVQISPNQHANFAGPLDEPSVEPSDNLAAGPENSSTNEDALAGVVAPEGTPPACAYFKEKFPELLEAFTYRDFEKTVDALTVISDDGGVMIMAAASNEVIDRAEELGPRIEAILNRSLNFRITDWAEAAYRYRRARRFSKGLSPNGKPTAKAPSIMAPPPPPPGGVD